MNKQVRIIICSMVLFTSCSMQPSQWLAGQGEKRGGPAADDLSLPDAADLETPSSDLPSDNRMRLLFGVPRVGMQPNEQVIKLQQELKEVQEKLKAVQDALKERQGAVKDREDFIRKQGKSIAEALQEQQKQSTAALEQKTREIEELQKQLVQQQKLLQQQTAENHRLQQQLATIHQGSKVDSAEQPLSQAPVGRPDVAQTQTGRTSPLVNVAAELLFASADPQGIEEENHDLVPLQLVEGQNEVFTLKVSQVVEDRKKGIEKSLKSQQRTVEFNQKDYNKNFQQYQKQGKTEANIQELLTSKRKKLDDEKAKCEQLKQEQQKINQIQQSLQQQQEGDFILLPAPLSEDLKKYMIDDLTSSTNVDVKSYKTDLKTFLGEFSHPLTFGEGYKNLNQNRCNSATTVLDFQANNLFEKALSSLVTAIKKITEKKKFAEEKYTQYPLLLASQMEKLQKDFDFVELQQKLDSYKNLKDELRKYFGGKKWSEDELSSESPTTRNNNYLLRAYIYYLLCDTPIKEWDEKFAEKLEKLLEQEKKSRKPNQFSPLEPETEKEIKALAL